MLLALGLIVGGVSVLGLRGLFRAITGDGITHQIMPELEPVDRIAADAGDLRGYNLLIISVDTTRADHVGCYGNRSVQTPVIDGLAREGVLCAQAVTPSPSTLPAHSSLLTGLYPCHHGARANGTFRLEEKVTTLAERLKARGYRTGAVISAFVLDSRFGLDQGFDLYHDDLTKGMQYSAHMFRERAAELTNEPATEWLREDPESPFFLWVHYFDPHAVYMPPEPFRSQYADDPYDGEIAYVDSQIGVLLEQLKDLGVRDKTLVVYVSDHGEGLGEHGEQTHSLLVYDSTLHVPMILNAPSRLPAGKVIHRQCCLVDVVPTALFLLGEEVPPGLDGMNLCAASASDPRPVLIETICTMTLHGWAPLLGVRRTDYKYILAPTPELYDLGKDPRELKNLHDKRPELVRELGARLASWLGKDPYLATRKVVDLSNLVADEEMLRHLGALGYVSSSSGETDPSGPLRDPKDMIVHWETVQQAINMRAQGQPKEAIPILEQCVADVPGDVFARSVLASAHQQMGDYEQALAHFGRAVEAEPNNESLRLSMAGVYLSQQEFEQAEEKVSEALKIEPEMAQAYVMRGQIAWARGKDDEALKLYRRAIEMDPGSVGPSAYNQIGVLHLYAGRLDEARDAFENTIRIAAVNGAAHDGLANILKLEGKEDAAIAELQIALQFDPNQPRALATLASLISQRGDQDKALALCQRALAVAPKFAPAHSNLGLIYRRRGDLKLAEQHYLKAIEYSPRLGAAHVNLAQLYTRQGKTDEAIEQFRQAVRANPQNPNPIALVNLGVYHFNKQEVDRALACYRRALQADPDYALAHKYIASIYALPQFDRPALTAYHLRRSLELDPQQPEASQMRDLLARAEKEADSRREPSDPKTPRDGKSPPADPPPSPAPQDPASTAPADGTSPASADSTPDATP